MARMAPPGTGKWYWPSSLRKSQISLVFLACLFQPDISGATCPVAQDLVIVVAARGIRWATSLDYLKVFLRALLGQLPGSPLRVGIVQAQANSGRIVIPIGDNRSAISVSIDTLISSSHQHQTVPNIALGLAQAGNMFQGTTASLSPQPSVLLVADDWPVSAAAVEAQIATLQSSGALLSMLWVGSKQPPASIPQITKALDYTVLGLQVQNVRTMVVAPCPCQNGSIATLAGPGGQQVNVASTALILAGSSQTRRCEDFFPGYLGAITLSCNSASSLSAVHACILAGSCAAGTHVNLTMSSGFAETDLAVRSLSSGAMQMRPCAGSTLTNPRLVVPATGLTHGMHMLRACATQFPGSDLGGELGMLCLNGQLRVFGQCVCTTDSFTIVKEETSNSQFLLGFLISLLVIGIIVGAIIVFVILRMRRKRVVPEHGLLDMHVQTVIKEFDNVESQTPWIHTENAECQTMQKIFGAAAIQANPSVCVTAAQTLPQVYAEVVRGSQCPLDLICCIDSSMSVGAAEFQKSKIFAERLAKELEMPPVRVGVIRFNHTCTEIAPLTSDKTHLLRCLAEMAFHPGETKFAPALNHAVEMFQESFRNEGSDTQAIVQRDRSHRDRVLVLMSDGDPADMVETLVAAAALKHLGVTLLFIQIGESLNSENIARLASEPLERHIIKLKTFDELVSATSDVLRVSVRVSTWVKRAKCSVEICPYQIFDDISAFPGYDLMVPGWERHGTEWWYWEPHAGDCIQHFKDAEWEPLSIDAKQGELPWKLADLLALKNDASNPPLATQPLALPDLRAVKSDATVLAIASQAAAMPAPGELPWSLADLPADANTLAATSQAIAAASQAAAVPSRGIIAAPCDINTKHDLPNTLSGSLSTTADNLKLMQDSISFSKATSGDVKSPKSNTARERSVERVRSPNDKIGIGAGTAIASSYELSDQNAPRVGICGELYDGSFDASVPPYLDSMDWIRGQLETRYGDLHSAFAHLDDNKTKILTVTKLIRGLDCLGITRPNAESIFKRLTKITHNEKRGSLELQDWLAAFGVQPGQDVEHLPSPEYFTNPLLASIDSILAQRQAVADSWRNEHAHLSPDELLNSVSKNESPSHPPFPTSLTSTMQIPKTSS